MPRATIRLLALAGFFLNGCGESVGPDTRDLVRVVATSPSFTLIRDDQGREEGELEVEVTNLNDVGLFVFGSCGATRFKLLRNVQSAWLEVGLADTCLAGLVATDVPAGESRLFTLKVLTEGPLGDGTYRVDLFAMAWVSDWDEALETTPLPYEDRLSNEFQIVVEGG